MRGCRYKLYTRLFLNLEINRDIGKKKGKEENIISFIRVFRPSTLVSRRWSYELKIIYSRFFSLRFFLGFFSISLVFPTMHACAAIAP